MPKYGIAFSVTRGDALAAATVLIDEDLSTEQIFQWIKDAKAKGYFVDSNNRVWLTDSIISMGKLQPPRVL
jgi:predicted ABC-type ATPase